jgi:hypothetical protein
LKATGSCVRINSACYQIHEPQQLFLNPAKEPNKWMG